MKIVVRARADEDLDRIYDWIAQDNPQAARDVIRRIRAKIGKLAETGFPEMGRPGIEPGTRELIEAPYIIIYEFHVDRDEVVILAIFHGAQDRSE
jgi:plasmid stabilization system protein ParE